MRSFLPSSFIEPHVVNRQSTPNNIRFSHLWGLIPAFESIWTNRLLDSGRTNKKHTLQRCHASTPDRPFSGAVPKLGSPSPQSFQINNSFSQYLQPIISKLLTQIRYPSCHLERGTKPPDLKISEVGLDARTPPLILTLHKAEAHLKLQQMHSAPLHRRPIPCLASLAPSYHNFIKASCLMPDAVCLVPHAQQQII